MPIQSRQKFDSQHAISKDRPLKNLSLLSISIGLAALIGITALPVIASAEAGSLKILLLGDSITHAEVNRASYRYPLWKKLIDADIEFDFVGSMDSQLATYSKGTPPQPDYKGRKFDQDHEGHFAWEANDIVNGRNPNNGTGSGSLSQWMLDYDFDIALVHLGTNDAFYRQSNPQVAAELKAVINTLREDNPNAIILLAKVIPTSRSKADKQAVEKLNGMIPSVASQMNNSASPVILVDQFTGFDANAETYDGVHPNALGEERIAQRWFDAITASLALVN
jgi:lysophospholipase L1-like esterase